MKKYFHLYLVFAFALSSVLTFAQKSGLGFNKSRQLKITQFTDVHFKSSNPVSDTALERINEVLDVEYPDLIVFTGAIIYTAPGPL